MLTDALNNLAVSADREINKLNYGGCCVFAALVARTLQDKGYKVSGVVASGWMGNGTDLDTVRPKLNNHFDVREWNNNGIDFGHVGVRIETEKGPVHYDSSGISTRLDRVGSLRHVYDGALTVEEMEALAATKEGWNPTFNRKQIPKLAELVAAHLENL